MTLIQSIIQFYELCTYKVICNEEMIITITTFSTVISDGNNCHYRYDIPVKILTHLPYLVYMVIGIRFQYGYCSVS